MSKFQSLFRKRVREMIPVLRLVSPDRSEREVMLAARRIVRDQMMYPLVRTGQGRYERRYVAGKRRAAR